MAEELFTYIIENVQKGKDIRYYCNTFDRRKKLEEMILRLFLISEKNIKKK